MAKLNLKYATMNSGKSIDLMRTAYNYEENGYRVLVFKPRCDTKGGEYLDSRIGLKRKVDLLIDDDTNIIEEVRGKYTGLLKCILVDEAEFLSPKKIDELFGLNLIIDTPDASEEIVDKIIEREKVRAAIQEVTGKHYKLGPYKKSSSGSAETKPKSKIDEFIENISNSDIKVTIEE